MTMEDELEKTSLGKRIAQNLASRLTWNKELFVFALLLYGVTSVVFDSARLSSWNYLWSLIWIDSFVLLVALAAVIVRVLPEHFWQNQTWGLTTNFAVAGVLGAAKNTGVYFWANAWGLDSSNFDPIYRVLGGGVMGIGIFASGGALLASRIAHEREMRVLLDKQSQLLRLQSYVARVASDAQAELVRQAKKSLVPQIQVLRSNLKDVGGTRELVTNLQSLIENHVRPLSRELKFEVERASTEVPNETARLKLLTLPKRFDLSASIRPIATLLIELPTLFLLMRIVTSPPSLDQLLIGIGINLLCLFLVREIWPTTLRPSRFSGTALVGLISGACVVPQILYYDSVMPEQGDKSFTLCAVFFVVLVITAIVMWVNVQDQSRWRTRSELASVNAQINRELALFDQRVWLEKRRWSYLLHGKVQAKLTAASLKTLKISGKNKKLDAEVVTEVQEVLDEIIVDISEGKRELVDLRRELENLTRTWAGIVEIETEITPKAWRVLEADQNAAMAVNEICRESATNSVRHGGASVMKISIVKPTDGQLKLQLWNNGAFPKIKEHGLGLQMMNALTTDWNFSKDEDNDLVLLTANLPVAYD